jgi:hypothetical protein
MMIGDVARSPSTALTIVYRRTSLPTRISNDCAVVKGVRIVNLLRLISTTG